MRNPDISRRSVLSMMMLGGGAVLLSSCGDNSASAPEGTAAPQGTPAPSSTSALAQTIRLTDQRGKTLTFDRPVSRVVTIPMPAASLLVAVDQSADHLSGMHNASWLAMRDGTMGKLFPKALTVPHDIATTDFTPNVESIRALNPDVVVQWSDSQLTGPLENAGLKVLGLTNTGQQSDVDAWVTLFSEMLGKPERATAIKSRSELELTKIRALAAGRSGPGPRILYFNRFTGGLKVAANGSYNDFYIKLVGGSNPATAGTGVKGSGMVGVDVEQVLAWNPEVVLLGNFDGALPQDIYSDPVWQNVSAVRERRVYKVPLGGYRWDPPGQESPLMWQWLTDISFPSQKSSALRGAIPDYYRFLYGQAPDSAEIDTILWMSVNSKSADYEQFRGA
ncbi:ABC transporter substrate-binding protein [Arthrobacter sp. H14-L1]|uniref:ABC transporter substrate-binding protein n=1 Tax=Arthrobacter sp. H14-L1 TaxID=2996697 RepID=UPI002271DBF7|nr:ABC transporter substrate-binding protein [Arthrobacter sp. H14-L1]MCY0906454.1 ABC transporter substrate-binding protein [Arthrobacter sp. H14-L1]